MAVFGDMAVLAAVAAATAGAVGTVAATGGGRVAVRPGGAVEERLPRPILGLESRWTCIYACKHFSSSCALVCRQGEVSGVLEERCQRIMDGVAKGPAVRRLPARNLPHVQDRSGKQVYVRIEHHMPACSDSGLQ